MQKTNVIVNQQRQSGQQHFNYKKQSKLKMSIRQSSFRSGFKDTLPLTDAKTHRKNQYSFASPFRNSEPKVEKFSHIKFRSPLREQEIHDYNRIKTELKKGIELAKQNISMNQPVNYVSLDDYNSLNQEHKYETERLLFEIQKLHQTIYQVERNKNLQIERLKDDHERMNYLNLSNVRQGHNSQVEMLETQLRKTKELLNDKTAEYENVIKRQEREIKHLNNQTARLNSEMRLVIEQKNTQLEIQQKSQAQKLNALKEEESQKIKEIEENHSKEINKLNRLLQQKDKKLQQSQGFADTVESQNEKLLIELENKRVETISRIGEVQDQTKQKYAKLKQTLQRQSSQIITQITKNYQLKQQVLQNEISQLKKFLTQKNQDRQNLLALHEERLQFVNDIKAEIERQNQELKHKLSKIKHENSQQLEVLKVKMAALHENDITLLVNTYEAKIDSIIAENKERQETITRLRKNLYEETNHRHQMRKKYSIEVSKLNERVIKLRSGLTAMQTDMREKIQNERSMLLLTSRNLIKDVQTKASNAKVYEIQLAKLQDAYRKHAANIEESGNLVDERIRIAEEELERLSKHIVDEKSRHQETENHYKEIVKNKDQTIENLRHELENIKHPEFDNSKELQMIQQLKDQLHQARVQNDKLKDQIDLLQKKINIMKAQLDQYEIQHQISHQQAKKQYQRISHQNMDQFQKFYEGRIATLEQEKADLKQVISSKEEKITSLVQKYQELEKTMKSTLAKIKKRTELETKVMNLGMDNNLVKNMAQIVRNNLEKNE